MLHTCVVSHTASYGTRKFPMKLSVFGNFLSGTLREHNSVCTLPPYGAVGEESFLLVFIRKISAVHRRSHTAFFGAPTRKFVGRGRRTPNSISHHLEHGSLFCWVMCDLCSMISVGGAWLGMATPQSVQFVAGVCRSLSLIHI